MCETPNGGDNVKSDQYTLNVLKSLDGLVSHLPKPEAEFSFGGGSSRMGFGSTYTPSQSFT